MMINFEIETLENQWKHGYHTRITRPYSAETVVKLQGSLPDVFRRRELASRTAIALRNMLSNPRKYITALGAMNDNQAVQMAKASLDAIYLSGWQVAGGANTAGHLYPDQSLYPVNSGPELAREINNALERADQIWWMENFDKLRSGEIDFTEHFRWFLPIVADAEAGFGGVLNVFELCKAYIQAGVAGIHLEDQLSSAKKCGHMGGKVLIPTQHAINNLVAARLAADVMDTDTVIIARTDALGAKLITSEIDERDHRFLTGDRTAEGFFSVRAGMDQAISRGLSYAPYADLLWFETSKPDLKEAKAFAEAIKNVDNEIGLAYNCSPSFNWEANLNQEEIANFQKELGAMGYNFQFITLAGFHSMNYSMFDLAVKYKETGMSGYVDLQRKEFQAEAQGYTATKHQREVGASYFDEVNQAIMSGTSSTGALEGSTEDEQF